MEIHNLYSLDIFIQGLFLLSCTCIGLFLIFKDNLETFSGVSTIEDFSNRLSELVMAFVTVFSLKTKEDGVNYKYLGLFPLIIAFSFVFGIMGRGLADKWIDGTPSKHFYLKTLWGENAEVEDFFAEHIGENRLGYKSYKPAIRVESFRIVYSITEDKEIVQPLTLENIQQLYYHAKHEIIKDKDYYTYYRKSQALSEYNRIFALGFFVLLVCSFINLLIMGMRLFLRKRFKINNEVGENETKSDTLKQDNKEANQEKIEDKNEENQQEKEKKQEEEKKQANGASKISNLVIIIFAFLSGFIVYLLGDPFLGRINNVLFQGICLLISYFGSIVLLLSVFKFFKDLRFSFFIYSVIYVLSFIGYLTTSKMWIRAEEKVAKKVFGIYKTEHLTKDVKDLQFTEEFLKLNYLNKEPLKSEETKDSIQG